MIQHDVHTKHRVIVHDYALLALLACTTRNIGHPKHEQSSAQINCTHLTSQGGRFDLPIDICKGRNPGKQGV